MPISIESCSGTKQIVLLAWYHDSACNCLSFQPFSIPYLRVLSAASPCTTNLYFQLLVGWCGSLFTMVRNDGYSIGIFPASSYDANTYRWRDNKCLLFHLFLSKSKSSACQGCDRQMNTGVAECKVQNTPNAIDVSLDK